MWPQILSGPQSNSPHPGGTLPLSDGAYVRDKYLNAIGGVRTPALDAPIATLWGGGNTGSSPLCFLLGITTPLPAAQLAALYPLHSDYVAAVARAAASAVSHGFLLAADALEIDQAAAASEVGLPAPTG
jgi:ABC-type amino acid transport system permease subunit